MIFLNIEKKIMLQSSYSHVIQMIQILQPSISFVAFMKDICINNEWTC